MVLLCERRFGTLSTSTTGTLMIDEPCAGTAGSRAVSTGESNVGVVFDAARDFLLRLLSKFVHFVCHVHTCEPF